MYYSRSKCKNLPVLKQPKHSQLPPSPLHLPRAPQSKHLNRRVQTSARVYLINIVKAIGCCLTSWGGSIPLEGCPGRITRRRLVTGFASVAALGILSLLPGQPGVLHTDLVAVIGDRYSRQQLYDGRDGWSQVSAEASSQSWLVVIACLRIGSESRLDLCWLRYVYTGKRV